MAFLDYRAAVEVILLIVAVALTYFKVNGFRKSNNPGNPGNPGNNNKTQMTKDITENKTRVENLEKGQTVLFEKVDKIVEDVSFIRGKMESK